MNPESVCFPAADVALQALMGAHHTGCACLIDCRVRWANREYLRLAGVETFDAANGRNILEWAAEHDQTRLLTALRHCSQHGSGQDLVVDFITPNGGTTPVEVSAIGVGSEEGTAVVLFCRDLTAQRALEDAMQRAQKMESLGVMAGGVAHDLKNLLTVILGHISLAKLERPNAPVIYSLARIEEASDHATGLCRELMSYAGRGSAIAEEVDISALANGVIDLLRVTLPRRTDIRTHLASGLPAIIGNPVQIQQVVMNLFINAGEAGNPGDGVAVSVATGTCDAVTAGLSGWVVYDDMPPAGRFVYLEVADTGRGMDANTCARIFEPYFSTKAAGGRGLGLTAVRSIVRNHHGVIAVRSAPGRGTTFRALFPAAAEAGRRDVVCMRPWATDLGVRAS